MNNRMDIERMLNNCRENLKIIDKYIAECPEGRLIQSTRNNRPDYIQVFDADNSRKWINKKPEVLQGLARKRFLQEQAKLIKCNIYQMEKFLRKYEDVTPKSIMDRLPEKFRMLPEKYFYINSEGLRDEEALEWAMADYEQSDFRPWEKTQTTSTGLRVRSKSEVLIADKAVLYGLPFRYEEVIYIENYRFAPDFVFLVEGELKYWEHCGRVDDPKYMSRHKWKLDMYEKAGIVPWKNLIITYDNEKGGIDSRIIDAEFQNKLLVHG